MSKSCFVLSPTIPFTWQSEKLGDLRTKRYRSSVVTLPSATFMLGGGHSWVDSSSLQSTDVLLAGRKDWVTGPTLPMSFYEGCAVPITQHSFLTVMLQTVREFDTTIGGPLSNKGWLPGARWPFLNFRRLNFGCSVSGRKLLIAGGFYLGNVFKSVEIVDLSTRRLSTGPSMLRARSNFMLVTVGEGASRKVLAMGGHSKCNQDGDCVNTMDSVEELSSSTKTWQIVKSKLKEVRAYYGAVALPSRLSCNADIPSISHGAADCPGIVEREVGTVCKVNCLDIQGYALADPTHNSIVCGWGSTWVTRASCGE